MRSSFPDHDADELSESKSERLSFRTTPRIKKVLQRAAALNGQDMSSFILTAAYDRALETIRTHDVTILTAVDHKAFFDALENPPAPTDKLRAAFVDHQEMVKKP